ncbi:hypothetical protein BDW22DRAFT_1355885 [Trametopsis cervina]|nr:hypothetical protein BDW22DRAFT_1355885 [Trametopsis cervina]
MSAFDIASLVVSILGTLLLLDNLREFIISCLPSTRLKELEGLLHETNFYLEDAFNEKLALSPSFLRNIENRLRSAQYAYEHVRTQVHCATDYTKQLKAMSKGLYTSISSVVSEVQDIRAQVLMTNELERTKAERKARTARPSAFGPASFLPFDDIPAIGPTPLHSDKPASPHAGHPVSLADLPVKPLELAPVASGFGASVEGMSRPSAAFIPKKLVFARSRDCRVRITASRAKTASHPPPISSMDKQTLIATGSHSAMKATKSETDTTCENQEKPGKPLSQSDIDLLASVVQRLRDNVTVLLAVMELQQHMKSRATARANGAAHLIQEHHVVHQVQDLFSKSQHLSDNSDTAVKK